LTSYLVFDAKYCDALRRGVKKATIRKVSKRVPLPGSKVYIKCGGRIIGLARIKSVVYKSLSSVTEKEALRDGFKSKEELVKALRNHYPDLKPETLVAVIEFEWEEMYVPTLPPSEIPRKTDKGLVKAAELALKTCELTREERRVLEAIVEEGSIGGAALRLGGLSKRAYVRRVMKRALKKLRGASIEGSYGSGFSG